MKFIETSLDHPLLRVALQAAPDMEIEWIRNVAPRDEWEMLFWARGGDFVEFESGLEADPTVTPERTMEVGNQRLYQVKITETGAEADIYPILVDIGGLVISATVALEGWYCRFGFPDQSAVHRFFETVEEYNVEFDLHRFYELQKAEPEPAFELTDLQRKTLITAFNEGFFEIPRQTSLEELSEKFGASDQAVSERIRRGLGKLVDNTLPTGQSPSHELKPFDSRVDQN